MQTQTKQKRRKQESAKTKESTKRENGRDRKRGCEDEPPQKNKMKESSNQPKFAKPGLNIQETNS